MRLGKSDGTDQMFFDFNVSVKDVCLGTDGNIVLTDNYGRWWDMGKSGYMVVVWDD